jgi:hypothetical protein
MPAAYCASSVVSEESAIFRKDYRTSHQAETCGFYSSATAQNHFPIIETHTEMRAGQGPDYRRGHLPSSSGIAGRSACGREGF